MDRVLRMGPGEPFSPKPHGNSVAGHDGKTLEPQQAGGINSEMFAKRKSLRKLFSKNGGGEFPPLSSSWRCQVSGIRKTRLTRTRKMEDLTNEGDDRLYPEVTS